MKHRRWIVILILTLVSSHALAQAHHDASVSSTVPDSARFEVVQSPLLVRLTFLFDRYTGETWQFVTTKAGGFAWEHVNRMPQPNDTKETGKVNYQIFLSGVRAQITLLVNTNTGVSWYVVEDPKNGVFWQPME